MSTALDRYIPIKSADSLAFSVVYRGKCWFLEYDSGAEYDDSLQGDDELKAGRWILSRGENIPPPRYVLAASAPFLHFPEAEREYKADMAAILGLIELDFNSVARERLAMHNRKKARKC